MACAGAVASGMGLLLPWLLSRRGMDPAYGSGPLATILQDILSVSIYFGFANLLL
jgi:magnesium transporter